MHKLFSVEVDGHGSMIARSQSGFEITRVNVLGCDTTAHVNAAIQLVHEVFEDLRAQGYPHAHDDEELPERV